MVGSVGSTVLFGASSDSFCFLSTLVFLAVFPFRHSLASLSLLPVSIVNRFPVSVPAINKSVCVARLLPLCLSETTSASGDGGVVH
ncbi:hypothetical protein SODALDRAFT_29247 [Sodiomyces alkalinus F11]|uniref:Uncharacterized protein n=1 Tax=Sodiomyces alkalinus (strain CBS 110278 / VKM F-3762 / F11) TaxID=1314773 RepID=A0A3N2Q8U5_SODAK|nr:hypothetical protein SODALDRAFT_29247 [Sodiomyces alkalinus F11]ROT43045.1 hypothetical protein SODALDRAFT_29247 [Sodiomyces alkalinus F11]